MSLSRAAILRSEHHNERNLALHLHNSSQSADGRNFLSVYNDNALVLILCVPFRYCTRLAMETQRLSIHPSPKRKRDEFDQGGSPVPTCLQEGPQRRYGASESCHGRNTIHTAVAGQFEDLDICPHAPASLDDTTTEDEAPLELRDLYRDAQAEAGSEKDLESRDLTPSRNRCRKDTPPDNQNSETEVSSPPNPSSSKQRPNSKQSSPHEPKKRCKSPPLTTEAGEDDLTWHDWEITGHDPTDPNDDGYGINGVGFKPTATVAWSRSQQRKKQVDDWRKRESREARNKRREKRDGIIPEDSPNTSPSSQKRVAFVT